MAAAEWYDATRAEAIARLPLLVEAELTAILSVAYWAPRDFDAAERQFLTTVADLAAQALARATRAEQLRIEARRHRLLSAAQAAINRRLDPAEQLRGLAAAVVPELADFASVHVLTCPVPPGAPPEIPVLTDRVTSLAIDTVETAPLLTGIAWHADDPMTRAIRTGGPILGPIATPGVPGWATRSGTTAMFQAGLNHLVLAPVLVEGLVVAVATFGMYHDRPAWDAHDLSTIKDIAGYAAVALEHGLTYQHTRQTALVLQRALLSEPPAVDGLELCARYVPAGRDKVGGDWYDAVELGPGRLAIAVGDVVGHDIAAAAAMGQLRAVLRALAMEEDLDPGAVLDRLAEANRRLRITSLATVLFGRLTRVQPGWRLLWATAGHLPPVLVEPGGPARSLDGPVGIPLVPSLVRPHRSARAHLREPGATLLLYTDGLVERRGVDLQTCIDDLCARGAALGERPIQELCDHLTAAAPGHDDTALLALRLIH
jgi:GAF domain-containing protein